MVNLAGCIVRPMRRTGRAQGSTPLRSTTAAVAWGFSNLPMPAATNVARTRAVALTRWAWSRSNGPLQEPVDRTQPCHVEERQVTKIDDQRIFQAEPVNLMTKERHADSDRGTHQE
jgi:hypothetical protein